MKHCTNCGKEINNIDKFCAHCGSSINNETIKADVKVEVTNATTEKAFKAVGDTISSGKQAVTKGAKATTGFTKKIFIPVAILVIIIGGIVAYTEHLSQQKSAKEAALYVEGARLMRIACKGQHEATVPTMNGNQSCAYYEFKEANSQEWNDNPWSSVRVMCGFSYKQLTEYKEWYYDKFSACH
jgi:hypothetical protein